MSWIGAGKNKVLGVEQLELCLWNNQVDKPSRLWDVFG